MTPRVAILGTGPTGLYTLASLVACPRPLDITLFESQAIAGWGMPYSPTMNGEKMLANIASIEIPPVTETLVAWLERLPDEELHRLGIPRDQIDPRAFYPRVTLGEYYVEQLRRVVARARAVGHSVTILTLHPAEDIAVEANQIRVRAGTPDGPRDFGFDHVVIATGHDWPTDTEERPLYFGSPYPTAALKVIRNVETGILGTSLSAIDAVVTVAESHGTFLRDTTGVLVYHPRPGTDGFKGVLMSRKGLLPEADFWFPMPMPEARHCTAEAIDDLIERGHPHLLEAAFDLFRADLVQADPEYAARLGLAALDVETFAKAYFAERDSRDPFSWAAINLAEARANHDNGVLVAWRIAILMCHENVGRIVPHLSPEDRARFGSWKSVFVDNYATVPHESIERLLALANAGKLEVVRLGSDYDLDREAGRSGASVTINGVTRHFPAVIDATGQKAKTAPDLPFPTLIEQGVIRPARGRVEKMFWTEDGPVTEGAGIDLDDCFRPVSDVDGDPDLYCLALPFLLHKLPFSQGLTSAAELGGIVGQAIRARVMGGSEPVRDDAKGLILSA